MIRIERISTFSSAGAERAAHAWRSVSAQPSWISRATVITFMIIIGLPLALLFLMALAAATIVFLFLAGINVVLSGLRSALPRDDGRKNVRVIQRR